MTKVLWLKFALCLLAILFLTAPRTAFAQEGHAPKGKGEAANEDHGGKGDHGRGEESTNANQLKAGEPNRIDTHIDAASPRPPPRRDDGHGQWAKLKSLPSADARLPHSPPVVISPPVARNAIGVALPRPGTATHPNGPAASSPVLQAPPAAVGVAPLATRNVGVGANLARSILVPMPRNGSISGTGMVHRGTGPPQTGGPAKSAAVINGAAIKPKR